MVLGEPPQSDRSSRHLFSRIGKMQWLTMDGSHRIPQMLKAFSVAALLGLIVAMPVIAGGEGGCNRNKAAVEQQS